MRSAVAAGCFTVACPVALTAAHDLSPAHLVVDTLATLTLAELNASVAQRERA